MNNSYIYASMLIIGLVTLMLRATPFLFGKKLKDIGFIVYIENKLPVIMMFILTFYAAGFSEAGSIDVVQDQLLALTLTVIIHFTLKNYLASILFGVVFYVYLTNSIN